MQKQLKAKRPGSRPPSRRSCTVRCARTVSAGWPFLTGTVLSSIPFDSYLPVQLSFINHRSRLDNKYGMNIPRKTDSSTQAVRNPFSSHKIKFRPPEKAWLIAALEDCIEIAEPAEEKTLSAYSRQFKLRMPRSLHRALAVHAKKKALA